MKKKDNMRQSMQINDDNSIRYLMREMDPSEEIEFEREMMSDENLLIEVESLRSTYQKIGKLPTMSAPSHLLDKVVSDAVEAQKKNIRRSYQMVGWLGKSVAAAAVIVLTVSTGYYFIPSDSTNLTKTTKVQSAKGISNIQPWVDRNEVISVTDRTNAIRSQQLDKAYNESYNKLILVKDSQGTSNSSREILYTNSPIK